MPEKDDEAAIEWDSLIKLNTGNTDRSGDTYRSKTGKQPDNRNHRKNI